MAISSPTFSPFFYSNKRTLSLTTSPISSRPPLCRLKVLSLSLPVFVTLPADTVSDSGQVKRKKTTAQSLRALAAAGVEGVVMEVWWGIVKRERLRVYDWVGYQEVVNMAKWCGLKVKAVLAFHQFGTGPRDLFWIPLPPWVLDEMDKNAELACSDRFGRRNKKYVSLGCDILPVLHGRSPIQAYADFMRICRHFQTPKQRPSFDILKLNYQERYLPFTGIMILNRIHRS